MMLEDWQLITPQDEKLFIDFEWPNMMLED